MSRSVEAVSLPVFTLTVTKDYLFDNAVPTAIPRI